jgi:hypothetical protein
MNLFSPPGVLVDFVGAVLVLALGLAVLRVRPRRRTNLAFVLFAVGFGARNMLGNLVAVGDTEGALFFDLGSLFTPLVVLGLVLLGLWVPKPLAREERALLVPAAVPAGLAVAQSFLTPDAFPSWFLLGEFAIQATYVFVLALLALRYARLDAGLRRRVPLVSAAFTLHPMLSIGTDILAPGVGASLSFAPILILGALWLRNASRTEGRDARAARDLALLTFGTALGGLLAGLVLGNVPDSGLYGVARFAAAGLLAYAILRQQLLGIDVKVKWTIRQSTVAAAFIGVFFVVSESASNFFASSGLGPYLGIAAAGMLVFAMAPLQRAAERVASAAMPGVKAPAQMGAGERAEAYRQQVEAAWADGVLTEDERHMLDAAGEALRLTRDEAAAIERHVTAQRRARKGANL